MVPVKDVDWNIHLCSLPSNLNKMERKRIFKKAQALEDTGDGRLDNSNEM